jgi:addiction module RelE/StbE family toxin
VKLVWTRAAHTDRKRIREYIARDNPAAALSLDKRISGKATTLTDHPGMGRPGRVAGTRELIVHPNYIVVYDVTTEAIRVLRVLHAAQQRPPQD